MPRRVVLISNALFGGRRTYRKTETKTRYTQRRLHKFSCVFCVVRARFGSVIVTWKTVQFVANYLKFGTVVIGGCGSRSIGLNQPFTGQESGTLVNPTSSSKETSQSEPVHRSETGGRRCQRAGIYSARQSPPVCMPHTVSNQRLGLFWEMCCVEQEPSPEAQVQTYDSSSKELPTPLGSWFPSVVAVRATKPRDDVYVTSRVLLSHSSSDVSDKGQFPEGGLVRGTRTNLDNSYCAQQLR